MDQDASLLARRLAANVKQLREARGLTQAQMAKLATLPRATWANLESGTANPTLSVLDRVARAFQVSLEELTANARAAARLYPKADLAVVARGTCSEVVFAMGCATPLHAGRSLGWICGD